MSNSFSIDAIIKQMNVFKKCVQAMINVKAMVTTDPNMDVSLESLSRLDYDVKQYIDRVGSKYFNELANSKSLSDAVANNLDTKETAGKSLVEVVEMSALKLRMHDELIKDLSVALGLATVKSTQDIVDTVNDLKKVTSRGAYKYYPDQFIGLVKGIIDDNGDMSEDDMIRRIEFLNLTVKNIKKTLASVMADLESV